MRRTATSAELYGVTSPIPHSYRWEKLKSNIGHYHFFHMRFTPLFNIILPFSTILS
jgi:hypothetical protein